MTSTMDRPTRPNGNHEAAKLPDSDRLDKSDIAKLSQVEIRQMSSADLIGLILVADIPMLRDYVAGHVWYSDRADLEKVAFLAQRTIQHQGY